jgi:hypothetical protein
MTAVKEMTLAEHTYRIGVRKLSAMEQFHVTRRLGPALVVCGVGMKMVMEGMKVPMEDWVAVAGPVMEIVAAMKDEDVEYVVMTCLKSCERMQNAAWAPLLTSDGKGFMFADMDQFEMIRLTVEVLFLNLSNFAKGMNADGSLTGA